MIIFFIFVHFMLALVAHDLPTFTAETECACGKNQYCFAKSCRACTPNSISMPGSQKIEDCLCNLGYSWEMVTEGKNSSFVCVKCIPSTFKLQQGNGKCQMCPANTLSPPGSVHKDNCTQPSDITPHTSILQQEATIRSNPRKMLEANLNQNYHPRRLQSPQFCCPGSFFEFSLLSGWGLKIGFIGNATTTSTTPFSRNFAFFRVSANGEFALGLCPCVTEDGRYCSPSIHKVNLTTLEDIFIAGNRSALVPSIWGEFSKGIDGPGDKATFIKQSYGDIAVAADGTYALITDLHSVRRIELGTYYVSSICGFFPGLMSIDISSDGTFALMGGYSLIKVELDTCNKTEFSTTSFALEYRFVRMSPDLQSAFVFDMLHHSIGNVSIVNGVKDFTFLAGGPTDVLIDGSGQMLMLNLNTLTLDTLINIDNQQVGFSTFDALITWRPCPKGFFSLASAATCQPCPQGGFKVEKACSQPWTEKSSFQAERLPPTTPGDGPCELLHLKWPDVTSLTSGAWTGGLGELMTQEVQVWACLSIADQLDMCRTSTAITASPWGGPAAACYVYNEITKQFAFWGTNHDLRLVK